MLAIHLTDRYVPTSFPRTFPASPSPEPRDEYRGSREAPPQLLPAPDPVVTSPSRRDDEVTEKAYRILQGNRVTVGEHTFTTPSLSQGETDSHLDYGGKQWLWDSAAHVMNLAWTEPEVAKAELQAVFAHQTWDPANKDHGFVPHMNYFHGDGRDVPDWAVPHFESFLESTDLVPADRRSEFLSTYWSSPVHSDITQPPILAMAAAELHEATGDTEFLTSMLPKLSAYYDYLHDRRADSDGLVRIIHPWESGWDNSQRWDEPVGLGRQEGPTSRAEIDRRKMHLFSVYKALDWDLDAILERGEFQAKPVDYNVLYAKNMECLGKLYEAAGDGEKAALYKGRAEDVKQAIFEKMWDGDKYCDLLEGDRRSPVKSAAMFYPMMLEGEPHGRELIANHLANPDEFNPPGGLSVPTTSLDDPSQEGDNYWRGNVWVIVNFFVRCGLEEHLKRHPGDLLARSMSERVRSSTFEALHRGDFFEYFNPEAGDSVEGFGVPSFGWNGLAVLMNKTPAFMQ